VKLRDIEDMVARNGLRVVAITQSKRIKVTVKRDDGKTEIHSFPRTVHERHALKNREAALARFAKGV
jgi:hypothetical protein